MDLQETQNGPNKRSFLFCLLVVVIVIFSGVSSVAYCLSDYKDLSCLPATPSPITPPDGVLCGAGILCYSVAPSTNRIFFLLGREANPTKKYWCDFGGHVDPGESEEETAAREFVEETSGILCDTNCPLSNGEMIHWHSKEDIARLTKALKNGDYTFRVRVCLNHGADPSIPRRYHITFVRQVPWIPHVAITFADVRQQLVNLYTRSEKVKTHLDEEEDRRSTSKFNPTPPSAFDQSIFFSLCTDQDATECITFNDCDMEDLSDDDRDDKKFICDFLKPHRGDFDEPSSIRTKVLANNLDELKRYYALLPECLKSHPAIQFEREGIPEVKPEYLEKEVVQYWSMERLKKVLDQGGYYKKEVFRSSFLPTIAAIMDAMQTTPSSEYTVYCKPIDHESSRGGIFHRRDG